MSQPIGRFKDFKNPYEKAGGKLQPKTQVSFDDPAQEKEVSRILERILHKDCTAAKVKTLIDEMYDKFGDDIESKNKLRQFINNALYDKRQELGAIKDNTAPEYNAAANQTSRLRLALIHLDKKILKETGTVLTPAPPKQPQFKDYLAACEAKTRELTKLTRECMALTNQLSPKPALAELKLLQDKVLASLNGEINVGQEKIQGARALLDKLNSAEGKDAAKIQKLKEQIEPVERYLQKLDGQIKSLEAKAAPPEAPPLKADAGGRVGAKADVPKPPEGPPKAEQKPEVPPDTGKAKDPHVAIIKPAAEELKLKEDCAKIKQNLEKQNAEIKRVLGGEFKDVFGNVRESNNSRGYLKTYIDKTCIGTFAKAKNLLSEIKGKQNFIMETQALEKLIGEMESYFAKASESTDIKKSYIDQLIEKAPAEMKPALTLFKERQTAAGGDKNITASEFTESGFTQLLAANIPINSDFYGKMKTIPGANFEQPANMPASLKNPQIEELVIKIKRNGENLEFELSAKFVDKDTETTEVTTGAGNLQQGYGTSGPQQKSDYLGKVTYTSTAKVE